MPEKEQLRIRTRNANRAKQVSLRLDEFVLGKIDKIAENMNATRSNVVSLILSDFVRNEGARIAARLAKEDAKREKPQIDLFG